VFGTERLSVVLTVMTWTVKRRDSLGHPVHTRYQWIIKYPMH